MELSQETVRMIEDAVKLLSKESTAPDKETPNWMEADIRRGLTFMAAKYEAAQKEITRIGNELVETDLQRLAEKKRADELQSENTQLHEKLQNWINEYRKLEEKKTVFVVTNTDNWYSVKEFVCVFRYEQDAKDFCIAKSGGEYEYEEIDIDETEKMNVVFSHRAYDQKMSFLKSKESNEDIINKKYTE